MKTILLAIGFSVFLFTNDADAMGMPQIPREPAGSGSVDTSDRVAATNASIAGMSFRYSTSHTGQLGVRFSGSNSVLTVIVGSRGYQYVLPAADGQFVNDTGYKGQQATVALRCSNSTIALDNGYGWRVNASCRIASITFKR